MSDARMAPEGRRSTWLWRIPLVAASYAAALAVATLPAFLTFTGRVIGHIGDPLMYFFLMRWSKASLLNGQSPFFHDGMHYPFGVPLGFFPPLHFQSLVYLLLSPFQVTDVLAYNIIWTIGVVGTGLSAFALAHWVCRDARASWLAGLAAMLSGPMMMHMYGHLDLIQLWGVPLFLIAWIRYIDNPTRGTLAAAVATFLVVTACAPYYMIFVLFPAAWYVLWTTRQRPEADRWTWLRGRLGRVIVFGGASLPGVALLLAPQIWSALHGYGVSRPRQQFVWFSSPAWSYVIPSPLHSIGKVAGEPMYRWTGYDSRQFESSSYLGLVVLGLLAYAALRRLRFPRASYWWTVLALMAVLSLGAELRAYNLRMTLPADWVWNLFPPFHLIRVPSRFNLFVAVCAAVPVAVALADLLQRVKSRNATLALGSILAVLVVVDSMNAPFPTSELPPQPSYYGRIRELARNDRPALLEAPLFDGSETPIQYALQGYWQMLHGMKTTGGYSSHVNVALDAGFVHPSPFWCRNLAADGAFDRPDETKVGVVANASIRDLAWLQLRHFHVDFLVVHHTAEDASGLPIPFDRLQSLFKPALLFETPEVAVYDPGKLPPPTRAVVLPTEGWRTKHFHGKERAYGLLRVGKLVAYSPPGAGPITLQLAARSLIRPRNVQIRVGDRVLARWSIAHEKTELYESPPIQLSSDFHNLTIESDSDDVPRRGAESIDHDKSPYSLIVESIAIGRPPTLAIRPDTTQGDATR